MIEIAGLAVASLSALGALVQAYYVAKANNKSVSKSKIKKSKERADKPLKIGAKKVSETIDDELLMVLKIKIEEQHTCNRTIKIRTKMRREGNTLLH